jgi:rRNA-processing protein EBP2
MAKGSRLKAALDAHKGVDYGKERQKKLQKQATKRTSHLKIQRKEIEVEDQEGQSEDEETGGVSLFPEEEDEDEEELEVSSNYFLAFELP